MTKTNWLALGESATLQQLAQELAKQNQQLFLANPLMIKALPWQTPATLDWQAVNKIIVISGNAANYGLAPVVNKLSQNCQIFTIGASTAKQIATFCTRKIIYPTTYNSENLLELAELQAVQNEVVVIFKGVGGRTILQETLQQRGAIIYTIDCYQREAAKLDLTKQVKIWQNNSVTGLIVSSAESLESFIGQFNQEQQRWLKQLTLIVTSKRLEQLAQTKGFQTIICAENFNAAAISSAIFTKTR